MDMFSLLTVFFPRRCPNCGREFAYKTSLKQHLKKRKCEKNLDRFAAAAAAAAGVQPPPPQQQQQQQQQQSQHLPPTTCDQQGQHGKQFQCPFCDKSYSWKQTLKQHVSMYHRDKVHTDEFWQYELSRRPGGGVPTAANAPASAFQRAGAMNGADPAAAEDLWRQQLGKHAEELSETRNGGHATNSTGAAVGRKRPPGNGPPSSSASSAGGNRVNAADEEMARMLALQAAGLRRQVAAGEAERRYVEFLEQVRLQREEHERERAVKVVGDAHLHGGEVHQPGLADLKEECAVQRTRMWLAQLGRYRQHALAQEELDRSHDELWEEQIARASAKGGRADVNVDVEMKKPANPAAAFRPWGPRPPSRPAPSATITRPQPPPAEETIALPRAAFVPDFSKISAAAGPPPPKKTPPPVILPLENDIPSDLSSPERRSSGGAASEEELQAAAKGAPEDDSVLKSLLLDRFSRKRPYEEPPKPPTLPKFKPPSHAAEDTNDILRRRLLGIKDPLPEPPKSHLPVAPAPTRPSMGKPVAKPAAKESDCDRDDKHHPNPGEDDARGEEDREEEKRRLSIYSRTSVLKHLLHRYTAAEGATAAAADS